MSEINGIYGLRSADYRKHPNSHYVVSKLSRNYPGGPCRTYGYFDVETLEDVI